MQKLTISMILFICLSSMGWTQKFEREYRINEAQFPPPALAYLKTHYPTVQKWKFYQETSDKGRSYEAKFKFEGHRISAEFGVDGQLQDTEKTVAISEIDSVVWQQISDHLNQQFSRWRILKIQAQTSSLGLRYEIELFGRIPSRRIKYQHLFSDDGSYLMHEEIVDSSPRFDFY